MKTTMDMAMLATHQTTGLRSFGQFKSDEGKTLAFIADQYATCGAPLALFLYQQTDQGWTVLVQITKKLQRIHLADDEILMDLMPDVLAQRLLTLDFFQDTGKRYHEQETRSQGKTYTSAYRCWRVLPGFVQAFEASHKEEVELT